MISIKGFTFTEKIYKNNLFQLDMAVRNSDNHSVLVKSVQIKNTQALNLLEKEFEISKQLDNDWAIKAIGLEINNDKALIIFENFKGKSLDIYLKREYVELNKLLKIAINIVSCVEKMHQKGFIHKDLKPANIKLNPETLEVRIFDFGIATKLSKEHIHGLPNPSTIEGTLAYISPEQTGRMNRVVDSRSDLYSLGISFYEMFTGKLPFSAQDPLEWVYCQIAQTAEDPHSISPKVPKVLSDIIMKLMSKVAEERYQTALGLKNDLEKCQIELIVNKEIKSFLLGEKDFSEKLQIAQKLYGREEELTNLLNSFNHVSNSGESELTLISGYSGIGKTSLVNELQKPILRQTGFFITGKFDQYKRDIPYYTISEAFKGLIKNILVEPENKILVWKDLFREALGINGQIIIDLIPQMELIIGKQEALAQVSAMEAQIRFAVVFEKFIQAIATKEHPLTIFLDDLQWADLASLNLINQLLSNAENKYILLIGAYRDNEVNPAHPLMLTLDEIKNNQAKISEIKLKSLSEASVNQFIADSLNTDFNSVGELANLVCKKTGGNPFFIIQLLTILYQDQVLRFNLKKHQWEWKISEIEAIKYTDNVVDLMAGKIKQLNVENQNLLKLAACVGNKFDRQTLSIISQQSENEINSLLEPSIEEGFLLSFNSSYEFLHDRIQQAAHSLLSESEKNKNHCKIGKLLLESTPEKNMEENIFIIANHLGYSPDCLDDEETQIRIAELNLRAGKKAKASSAYHSAKSYFLSGINLLDTKSWNLEHELTFQLYLELSTCEYLLGNFKEAEKLFDTILSKLESPIEMAKVCNIRLELYQTLGKFEDATILGLETLKILGLPFPESDTDQAAYGELLQVQEQLKDVKIEDLLNKSSMEDPVAEAAMSILMNLFAPFYNARPHLLGLLTFRMTNYSLKYGNTVSSPYAYLYYGILLGTGMGDYKQGQKFGDLALALNEKQEHKEIACKVFQTYGGLVHPWSNPIHTSSVYLNKSYLSGLETGDLIFSGFAVGVNAYQKIMCGQDLQAIYTEAEKYIPFFKRSKDEMMFNAHRVFMQHCLNLMGKTQAPDSLSSEGYDEELMLARMHEKQFAYSFNCYYIVKMQVQYHNGKYKEALETANKIKDYVALVHFAQVTVTEFSFYYALILIALYPKASETEKEEYVALVQAEQDKIKKWAENCPENFEHKYLLISAEIEYILNPDSTEIMSLYEDSIKSAKKNKFIQNEALAFELASTYYKNKGFQVIFESYLKEAKSSYLRWGAKNKVDYLENNNSFLKEKQLVISSDTIGDLSVQHLDLHTIIKASHAISSPLDMKELTASLMRIVMEQTGARRAVLLLNQNNEMSIVAESILNGSIQINTYDEFEPTNAHYLPEKIIQYVKKTKETVILEDASQNSSFNADEYLRLNKAKSIICLPIIKQAKLIGILYLENNLFTGAFTKDKISLLQLIALQAAISIENAIAFKELNYSEIKLKEYKHFFNHTNDFSCIANVEGYFEIINPNFMKILGYSEQELLQNQFISLVHPDDIDATLKEVEKLKAGAVTASFKNRYRKKDGSYLWLDWNATPNLLTGKLYGIARDITDKKQAEEEIQRSEARFRRFAEISNEGVVIHDEGTIIEVNPAFAKMFAYGEQEVIGMHALQFTAPESIDILKKNMSKKSMKPFEALGLRKDKSVFYTELQGRKIDYKGRKLSVTTILDISSRKKAESELHENEERFRLLAESTNIIPWEADATTFQFTYIGPQVESILGYPTDAWYSNDFWPKHIHLDDREKALKYCLESYLTKKDYEFEYRMIAANGEIVWFHDIVNVVIENDKPVLLRGFLVDISARKETESKVQKLNTELQQTVIELSETEQELRTESEYVELLQNVAAAANEPKTIEEIVQITLDKICKLTNWPLGHLYLVHKNKPDKLHSTKIWNLDQSKQFKLFKKITEETDFELGIGLPGRVWKSKTSAWLPDVSIDTNFPRNKVSEDIKVKAGFAFPIMVGDDVAGVLEFFSHQIIEKPNERLLEVCVNIGTMLGRVIERNQASEKLQKEQMSLSQAQRLAHIGSWELDLLGNKMQWSDELYKIYGLYPQEFEANYENYLKYIHPEDKEYFNDSVQQAIKDHKSFSLFHKVIRQDGTQRIVSSKGNVFVDSKGNTIKMTGTSQDVTEMKEAELEIKKLNTELEQRVVERTAQLQVANKELEKAKEIAEQALEIQEQFLANTSHEIRTPMNGVIGMTRQLLETPLSIEQTDYLNAIQESSNNLLYVVNDILDISKIRAGKIVFEKIEFRLTTFFKSLQFSLQYRIDEKNIFLKTILDDDLPEVLMGDPIRLNQILLNLAGNAIKFTESGGITFLVKKETDENDKIHITFSVIDTGIGIAEDKLDYVFESFAQAGNQITRKYGGTGLGLSISKSLIEKQGGTISVKSELGIGSSFTFTLPFEIGDENWQGNIFQKVEGIPADVDLSDIQILVVDDSEINQRVAIFELNKWKIKTDLANNAHEAFEKLKTKEYDLILMDISMPEMDGLEATRYIRTKLPGKIKNTPIIAMTASALTNEKDKCFAAGMNDYISKPFNPVTLYSKIVNLALGEVEASFEKKVKKKAKIKQNDLSLLREHASGDLEYIKEMITLYMTDMPEYFKELNQFFQEENWQELSKQAHKIKSPVTYFGNMKLKELLAEIEFDAKNEVEKNLLQKKIQNANELCLLSIEELNKELDIIG